MSPPEARRTVTRAAGLGRACGRAAGTLVLALVVVAPLAIGTVHPVPRAIVFSACTAALGLLVVERLLLGKRIRVTVPLVALAVAFLATLLQLAPIPAPVVAHVSPAAHETLSMTLGDYGWHALSLDPAGTAAELAKIGAYLAFFAVATHVCSKAHRRRQILLAVSATAALVAVIGLVQALFQVDRVLGLYRPENALAAAVVRGTFVNPNNFGALMCLGAATTLAVGLRMRELRWIAFPALVVINLAAVLSLSRSTLIAAPLAQLLTFVMDRRALRRSGGDRPGGLDARTVLLVTAAAAIAVGASLVMDPLKGEVARTERELASPTAADAKFHAWRDATALVWSHPWTGVGRGAFEQAFTRLDEQAGVVRHRWLENGYLQAFVDWGVPVGALLILLAGWSCVLGLARLGGDPLLIGAFAGLVALGVHDTVDFAAEIPGVALPALAMLASIFGQRSHDGEPGQRRLAFGWVGLLAPAVVAAAVGLSLAMPSAEADAAALARVARSPAATAVVLARGEAARGRHPADYFIHALVGERLARDRHPDTMRWLNAALYLNPRHAGTHLVAAEVLAATGHRSQALIEFREAASDSRDPVPVWQRVLVLYRTGDAVLAATADTPTMRRQAGAWLVSAARLDAAEEAFDGVLARAPSDVVAHQQLALIAARRHDGDLVQRRLGKLAAIDKSLESRRIAVRCWLETGRLAEARTLLDTGIDRTAETFELELSLAEAYSRTGAHQAARERLVRLNWPPDRTAQIHLHRVRASVEQSAGNEHQYRWETEQARRLEQP